MPIANCPDCGAELSNGLCPRCLVKLGLDGPGSAHAQAGDTLDLPARPGSVLESIGATIGGVPRVLLRDTGIGETPSPIIVPTNGHETSTRYRIDGEIARGGMGAILKGRDPDLGRDVAIKVLREDLHENGELVRRFVEEAQIGGQLQHPGVVPIYELGTFADLRPFFSMKLVKGQTLADLLKARPTPADDLPRFLSIFQAIAQTMAYAHTRGVIHRDLKPSNVMVGSFGEVQVMDWGLAKVLARGGVVDDAKAGKEKPPETLIATARSSSDRELSHAGSVLGTPSYMAPEQARGKIDLIDERADVFALGAILCDILTGSPAFTGRTSGEILRKASRGDTADALTRLDACGAEVELISLAKDCLAIEPEDRPHDAKAVAERITSYLAGVQERVQIAERERAVAVAKAIEERRRRKVQLALAASILAFATLGGLSTVYYLQQRAEQAATAGLVVGRAETLLGQARENPEDLARWQVALAAVEQAEAARGEVARPRLLAMRADVKAGLEAAQRDKTLLDRLVDIRSAEADDPDGSVTDADYADAFRDARIDVDNLPPAQAGARIKARPPSVALALAGSLDDWVRVRRTALSDRAGAARLGEAARIADPDPWRAELRTTLDQSDKAARLAGLRTLARKAKFEELGPISLQLLGTGLNDAGDGPLAELVLRAAQHRHPRDIWVNYALGRVLEKLSRRDEAIRFYTAARSIRPETAHALAHALEDRGNSDEAIAVFRDLKGLRPGNARHLVCLGLALKARGLSREASEVLEAAVTAGREAIRLKPANAQAHFILGYVLYAQGKLDEAVTEYREAIRLEPDYADAHFDLGLALYNQGRLDEAVTEFREVIRLEPANTKAHGNLGLALVAQGKFDEAVAEYREVIRLKPDDALAHSNLGLALVAQGKFDEAVAEYREVIRLKPDDALAHARLGAVLCDEKRDFPIAEAEFREAIRLKPDYASARYDLGIALHYQGKLDEAVDEYREAIRLKTDHADAHYKLGIALHTQGKLDEAIAEYREAIRLKPDHAEAHHRLGVILCDAKRDFQAAEAEFREAIRLKPDHASAHFNLGLSLKAQGKLDEAVAAWREAIRLKLDIAEVHSNLGVALNAQGKLDEAVAEYREVIRLKPDDAETHYNLGNALRAQGKLDEAVAEYREAIRLQPDYAEAHCNLGLALQTLGDHAGSLAMLRKGHELGSKQPGWRYPSAQWVAQAERLAAMAERLPYLLKGDDRPKDNAERLAAAQMCYDTKRHAAATRFYAEALEADPRLGDDRRAGHRFNAACAASLAAAGQGKDDPAPVEAARTKLREQAMGWLKAELAVWTKLLESVSPQSRPFIAQTLKHWKQDTDLAGIRDAEALAKLPEAERKDWQALWAGVDALLARAEAGKPN